MLDRAAEPPPEPDADRSPPSLRGGRDGRKPDKAKPADAKRRRRRPLVATLSGLLSFIGIAAVALVIVWALGLQRLTAPGPLATEKVVVIQPGNDLSVVDQLAEAGVIEDRALMTAAFWLEGNRGSAKAGEYLFKPNASLRDVMDLILSGKQVLHAVTMPEGLTSEQVLERLRENDVLIGDVGNTPAEGTLMPDTFKFARGTTRDQVVRSMQAEQRRVLADVWAKRSPDIPVRSPFELVTLASIVEKETGRADEWPHVASVFINRLQRGMPLQSDPTVIYGVFGGKGAQGRGPSRSELDAANPYNTYVIRGLPPGPIANPGKAALEAVANPARTRDLYFVADGTGGHVFADTYDAHRQNVARWRQIEKDRGSPDATGAAPGATPGARPDQRGDASDERVPFGSLALDISGRSARALVAGITSLPINRPASAAALSSFAAPRQASVPVQAPVAATFDELDVEVAGVHSRSDPATWEDGFEGPVATLDTFPVPAQRLAEQQAQAAALGVQGEAPPARGAVVADANGPGRSFGKGKVIDASEGTAFDPLLDRSYDLNSAKVVPVIKVLPPVQALAVTR